MGMGTNMYPSSSLLGAHKDESIAALPVDELIEKADGFAGVFPGKALCTRNCLLTNQYVECTVGFDELFVIVAVLPVHDG